MGRVSPSTIIGVFLVGFVADAEEVDTPIAFVDTVALNACKEVPVVLSDVDMGWEDTCKGLEHQEAIGTSAACQAACVSDASCSVWQFYYKGAGDNKKPFCWKGIPNSACRGRIGFAVSGGQRLQHGRVELLESALGIEVKGLKAHTFETGTDTVSEKRCREQCYSDITCGVWQFTADGCWVEHGPKFLRKKSFKGTAFANAVTAGEFIKHYCPLPPKEEPAPSIWESLFGGGKLAALLIIALVLCGLCGFKYMLDEGRKAKKRQKTTRAVKTFASDDENVHEEKQPVITWVPQILEYIPQVPPLPVAYSLLSQQPPAFQAPPSVVLQTQNSVVLEQAPLLVPNDGRLV